MTKTLVWRVALCCVLAAAILVPASLSLWQSQHSEPFKAFLQSLGLRDVQKSVWDTGENDYEASLKGCPDRIHILVVSSMLDDQPNIERHLPSRSVKTIFYLGNTWTSVDYVAVWTDFMRTVALNFFRKQPLIAITTMIEVVSPARCDAINSLDWQNYWSKWQTYSD
jgi:hypothetical protein